MKETDYKGKYFSVFGDSISTLEGYSEPESAVFYNSGNMKVSGVKTPSDTWWGIVIERLKGKLLVNNSCSGSTVCRSDFPEVGSYACGDKRTSALGKGDLVPDVIMVYLGTNDWGFGKKVFFDERYDSENDIEDIFSSAYGLMLKKLTKNYPDAEIWCFTIPRNKCPEEDNGFPFFSKDKFPMNDYCEVIRTSAKKCGCRLIDLYKNGELFDAMDDVHPLAEGMRTISKSVLKELNIID